MPTLFLIRHGATQWAQENRFAGWADAPLSEKGLQEAALAAQSLKSGGYSFDICFTSRLMRATKTAFIITEKLGMTNEAVVSDWRLNERHYGALQGRLRREAIEQYGNAQVVEWRRAYHERPPELEEDDPRWAEQLERIEDLLPELHPRSESLAQAAERVEPVWRETIAPALRSGKRVLVVAHTSSIRGLVRCIEGLDDDQCAAFRISTALPRRYALDDNLAPLEIEDLTSGWNAKVRYWINRKKPRWLGGI